MRVIHDHVHFTSLFIPIFCTSPQRWNPCKKIKYFQQKRNQCVKKVTQREDGSQERNKTHRQEYRYVGVQRKVKEKKLFSKE